MNFILHCETKKESSLTLLDSIKILLILKRSIISHNNQHTLTRINNICKIRKPLPIIVRKLEQHELHNSFRGNSSKCIIKFCMPTILNRSQSSLFTNQYFFFTLFTVCTLGQSSSNSIRLHSHLVKRKINKMPFKYLTLQLQNSSE